MKKDLRASRQADCPGVNLKYVWTPATVEIPILHRQIGIFSPIGNKRLLRQGVINCIQDTHAGGSDAPAAAFCREVKLQEQRYIATALRHQWKTEIAVEKKEGYFLAWMTIEPPPIAVAGSASSPAPIWLS